MNRQSNSILHACCSLLAALFAPSHLHRPIPSRLTTQPPSSSATPASPLRQPRSLHRRLPSPLHRTLHSATTRDAELRAQVNCSPSRSNLVIGTSSATRIATPRRSSLEPHSKTFDTAAGQNTSITNIDAAAQKLLTDLKA